LRTLAWGIILAVEQRLGARPELSIATHLCSLGWVGVRGGRVIVIDWNANDQIPKRQEHSRAICVRNIRGVQFRRGPLYVLKEFLKADPSPLLHVENSTLGKTLL
jgi:hypothetical protein